MYTALEDKLFEKSKLSGEITLKGKQTQQKFILFRFGLYSWRVICVKEILR